MKYVLPVIVVAQFLCTSVWFASNAILPELTQQLDLTPDMLGHLTSAVLFGFIAGTFSVALIGLSDRFSPSRVFFICSILAALANATVLVFPAANSLLASRFLSGFFLAGIYPVGMKIAADHYSSQLGKALGYLVGALVLGTALPHALRSVFGTLPWMYVVITTSLLAVIGGTVMVLLVPDGPHRKAGAHFSLRAFAGSFRSPNFRAAAFGYFGHMWELYAFWAFVPVILSSHAAMHGAIISVPLLSFLIIGIGGLACAFGGLLSSYIGAKRVALGALSLSGLCCLVSPVILIYGSTAAVLCFLLVWGIAVVADSPMLSTLVANSAAPELRGSALTIVNCIGFSITIASVQLLALTSLVFNTEVIFLLLVPGPLLGVTALRRLK